MEPNHEDRGTDIEGIIASISVLAVPQKQLVLEYLTKTLTSDLENAPKRRPRGKRATTSSLEELVRLYPNIDFAGFISWSNDKEQYQLWKLIDAFEEVVRQIGRKNFEKLHMTLIVFGDRITYVSDGSIAVNYERFSEEDLVKQLTLMFRSQG